MFNIVVYFCFDKENLKNNYDLVGLNNLLNERCDAGKVAKGLQGRLKRGLKHFSRGAKKSPKFPPY